MSRLRVVVVDDEPLARERVRALVCASEHLELVAEARSGLEALHAITTLAPDLVLIDVEMPELSGFGVIAALDGERVPGVVFVTAFEHYAMQAFDVGAIDYLHKPVTRERFAAAIERARGRLGAKSAGEAAERQRALVDGAARAERTRGVRTRFVVRDGGGHRIVPVAEVDWIDVADNYLRLHVREREFLCRATLGDAESELDPERFVRVHRSASSRSIASCPSALDRSVAR